jgi:hypothetical protein
MQLIIMYFSPAVTFSLIGPDVLPRTVRRAYYNERRDSSDAIATGCGLDEFRVPVGSRIFTSSRPVLGPTQPPLHWYWGGGAVFPGREAENSLPTSAEVKQTGIYASTPPYAFIA